MHSHDINTIPLYIFEVGKQFSFRYYSIIGGIIIQFVPDHVKLYHTNDTVGLYNKEVVWAFTNIGY